MQRHPAHPAVLAVAITLMCVLAGCEPRSTGDGGAAASAAPASAGASTDRNAGGASGDAATRPAAVGDEDVLSGVPESIPLPARDTATAALPDATEVTYACADGSDLRVRYAAGRAGVILGMDSVVSLALSPEASAEHGGEVYVGQGQGLRRIGGVVEFDPGRGEAGIRRCREASSTA